MIYRPGRFSGHMCGHLVTPNPEVDEHWSGVLRRCRVLPGGMRMMTMHLWDTRGDWAQRRDILKQGIGELRCPTAASR